mmetsp:Transcript_127928/g.272818  ORF Transcript_127928/g.272818 Transcript_127928/m.272818 type:complete len:372 (-) Transcript_127928:102-1217(-)
MLNNLDVPLCVLDRISVIDLCIYAHPEHIQHHGHHGAPEEDGVPGNLGSTAMLAVRIMMLLYSKPVVASTSEECLSLLRILLEHDPSWFPGLQGAPSLGTPPPDFLVETIVAEAPHFPCVPRDGVVLEIVVEEHLHGDPPSLAALHPHVGVPMMVGLLNAIALRFTVVPEARSVLPLPHHLSGRQRALVTYNLVARLSNLSQPGRCRSNESATSIQGGPPPLGRRCDHLWRRLPQAHGLAELLLCNMASLPLLGPRCAVYGFRVRSGPRLRLVVGRSRGCRLKHCILYLGLTHRILFAGQVEGSDLLCNTRTAVHDDGQFLRRLRFVARLCRGCRLIAYPTEGSVLFFGNHALLAHLIAKKGKDFFYGGSM